MGRRTIEGAPLPDLLPAQRPQCQALHKPQGSEGPGLEQANAAGSRDQQSCPDKAATLQLNKRWVSCHGGGIISHIAGDHNRRPPL
jgi:hypothetical protein